MNSVSNPEEIEKESKRVINSLYGDDVSDFTVSETFALPEKGPRVGWDVQVRFMQNNLKHTVDLEFEEKTGRVVNARLLDAMNPI